MNILFHDGFKFDLSPYKIKSIRTNDGVTNLTLEMNSDAGLVLLPGTAIFNGNSLRIMTIDGNCLNYVGIPAQYEGGNNSVQ